MNKLQMYKIAKEIYETQCKCCVKEAHNCSLSAYDESRKVRVTDKKWFLFKEIETKNCQGFKREGK